MRDQHRNILLCSLSLSSIVLNMIIFFLVFFSSANAYRCPSFHSHGSSLRTMQTWMSISQSVMPTVPSKSPPTTFLDCVYQAQSSTRKALDDGYNLIEVEFPPLPLEFLEDSSSSARSASYY